MARKKPRCTRILPEPQFRPPTKAERDAWEAFSHRIIMDAMRPVDGSEDPNLEIVRCGGPV